VRAPLACDFLILGWYPEASCRSGVEVEVDELYRVHDGQTRGGDDTARRRARGAWMENIEVWRERAEPPRKARPGMLLRHCGAGQVQQPTLNPSASRTCTPHPFASTSTTQPEDTLTAPVLRKPLSDC
jgi:hypothetical protein